MYLDVGISIETALQSPFGVALTDYHTVACLIPSDRLTAQRGARWYPGVEYVTISPCICCLHNNYYRTGT